jgi:hypothetical protein
MTPTAQAGVVRRASTIRQPSRQRASKYTTEKITQR